MENNPMPKVNTIRLGNVKTNEVYIELGVYLTLICNFFILWGNSQKITTFVSWPTRLMISYIFLLAAVFLVNSITCRKVGLIDAWFVALAIYTAVCFVMGRNLGRLVQYMCFAMLPSCIVLYRRVVHVRRMKRAVYIANNYYAILFVLLSFADNSHHYQGEYSIEILEELTLGFRNTNETGIYLMLSFLIMISSVFFWKKRWQKRAALILSVVLWCLLVQTKCRMTILLAAIAAVLAFLQRSFKLGSINRRIVLLLPAISFLATILFPETIGKLLFMGEQLDTGRYGLYQGFLGSLDIIGILVGDVPGFMGGNLHNSYLSVVASYGVLNTIFYIFFLNAVLREQQANAKKSEASYVAYLGVLCVIAHGISEGTLLIAGTVYAGMAGLLFLLTLPEEETV